MGGEGWGGGGGVWRRRTFEPQEFFSLSNSSNEFFLGHSMNIFFGLIGVHEFFFHLIFPCSKFFFCTSPALPHKFLMVLLLTKAIYQLS